MSQPKFQPFVTSDHINKNGFLLVRHSDNVLHDSDWTTYRLFLKNGKVTEQLTISQGLYQENHIGETIKDLGKQSCFDPDEHSQHPALFFEISVS